MSQKLLSDSVISWTKQTLFNKKVLLFSAAIWVLFQVIFVTMYHYDELVSDPGFYVYYAEECIKHGTMFPDYSNYHSEYIYSPGWINFIILWIKIFGSVHLLPYFNIVLNVFILWLLYKITQIITDNKTITYMVLYLFMILPSNSTITNHLFTEIPFEFLSLLSFYLIFSKKYWHIAVAGIFIALAQWVRPLAIAWMLASVFLLVYKNRRFKALALYLAFIVLTSGSIALISCQYFPKPIFQAQTAGVNLIMGANDKANGGYCVGARRDTDGLGYLPGLLDSTSYTRVKSAVDGKITRTYSNKYTYLEVDSIYKARAINWIVNNPGKWLSLIPKKLYYLFCAAPSFAFTGNTDVQNSSVLLHIIGKISHITGRMFLLMVIVSFVGLFFSFWKNEKMAAVFIIIFITTAMTVAVCTSARYNFIIIPFILIFACNTLKLIYDKLLEK